MSKQKTTKHEQTVTAKDLLNQLQESLASGINNITKELEVNKALETVLEKEHNEKLDDILKQVKESIKQYEDSLKKINNHKILIDEIIDAAKDKKILDVVEKLLLVLLRK